MAQRAADRDARGFWDEPTPKPLPAFAAALRRRLLAKGLTRLPTCEMCQREVPPKAIQADLCPSCKAERDEAAIYFQRLNDETDWPVLPAPEYPMLGSEEAGRPFLPDDAEDML